MASVLQHFSFRNLVLLYLVFFLFASSLVFSLSDAHPQRKQLLGRRKMLAVEQEEQPKKKTNLSTKNQTKLIKPTTNSTKNSKPINSTSSSSSNSTKPSSNSTKKSLDLSKDSKRINSTSSNTTNSTKPSSISTKKSLDLSKDSKSTTSKNKTQPIITKQIQTSTEKKTSEHKLKNPDKIQFTEKKPKQQKTQKPNWMNGDNAEEDDDLISEFRDLPSKFHQTLLPDLERISTTSKAYLTKANKEITKGFKPLVGNKYASTIASIISCVFLLVPLLLVSLIVNQIKAYFSLQKILIFIQAYLSIYFSILSLASLVTGIEPLKFFYTTSQSSYICLQILQMLGYVLYLLLLLVYLVLVFSTETGLGSKALGLGQTIVGFAVGLHYYAAVFHRAVLHHRPPKTNWKVHGIYATFFFLICLLASAERRKKAYLEDGGEEGKKS